MKFSFLIQDWNGLRTETIKKEKLAHRKIITISWFLFETSKFVESFTMIFRIGSNFENVRWKRDLLRDLLCEVNTSYILTFENIVSIAYV